MPLEGVICSRAEEAGWWMNENARNARYPPLLQFTRTCENLRVANGTRTRDNQDHNPVLCQLSYSHHPPRRSDVV